MMAISDEATSKVFEKKLLLKIYEPLALDGYKMKICFGKETSKGLIVRWLVRSS